MPAKTNRDRKETNSKSQIKASQHTFGGCVNPQVLDPHYLNLKSSSQLLSALLDTYKTLDYLSIIELTTGNIPPIASDSRSSSFSYPIEFIEALSQKEYLSSPSPDVQVMTACCLSCVFGGPAPLPMHVLSPSGANSRRSRTLLSESQSAFGNQQALAAALGLSKLVNIIELFATSLSKMTTCHGEQSYHTYIRQLVEKLGSRNIIFTLYYTINQFSKDEQDTSEGKGSSLIAATRPSSVASKLESSLNSLINSVLTIRPKDEFFANHLVTIFNNVIDAQRGKLSENQLNAVLSAVVGQQKYQKELEKGKEESNFPCVLSSILRRNEDVLQVDLSAYVCSQLKTAVEGYMNALQSIKEENISGLPNNNSSSVSVNNNNTNNAIRKLWMRKVIAAFDFCVFLFSLSLNIMTQIVTTMQQYLFFDNPHNESGSTDIRLVATRAFSRIFGTNPNSMKAASTYPAVCNVFLERFHDIKSNVRIEMIRYSKTALMKKIVRGEGGSNNIINNNIVEKEEGGEGLMGVNWANLSPLLVSKLTDVEETVRCEAVNTLVDLAMLDSKVVSHRNVYEQLALRCKDKQMKVRNTAVTRLIELYSTHHRQQLQQYKWIPNAVFSSAFCPGADVSVIDFALSDLLIKKAHEMRKSNLDNHCGADSSKLAMAMLKSTSQLNCGNKQQSKLHFSPNARKVVSTQNKNELLFSLSSGSSVNDDNNNSSSMALFFASFCSFLNKPSWELLLTLMQKKAQLRLTMCRFVQVRHALKSNTNSSSSVDIDANGAIASRLIQFVNNLAHAKSDEIILLMVEKDETTTRQLLALCEDSVTDYYTQGELHFLPKARGRSSKKVYDFLVNNLTKRLYVPFAQSDVADLIGRIQQLVSYDNNNNNNNNNNTMITVNYQERLGLMRALTALTVMAPQLMYNHAQLLVNFIRDDYDNTVKVVTSDINDTAITNNILFSSENNALQAQLNDIASVEALALKTLSHIASDHQKKKKIPEDMLIKDTTEQKRTISILRKISLSPYSTSALVKLSMGCLVNLFPPNNFVATYTQLSQHLQQNLKSLLKAIQTHRGPSGGYDIVTNDGDSFIEKKKIAEEADATALPEGINLPRVAIVYTKAFTILVKVCNTAIRGAIDSIVKDVKILLKIALRNHGNNNDNGDEIYNKPRSKNNTNVINSNTRQLLTQSCFNAEVVDSSAKALAAYTLSLTGVSAAAVVPEFFDFLVMCIKEIQQQQQISGSVESLRKRLAIVKQLIKIFMYAEGALVISSGDDRQLNSGKNTNTLSFAQRSLLNKEIMLMSVLSTESNDEIRHTLQLKLKNHILRALGVQSPTKLGAPFLLSFSTLTPPILPKVNTRHLAMLVATACSETTKSGYNGLRSHVEEVAVRMCQLQQTANITTLTDVRAPKCFVEYVVPFLVFYLAHHPFYMSQRYPAEGENAGNDQSEEGDTEMMGIKQQHPHLGPFVEFIRPWQLLFNELFRQDTRAASALQEMLRKLITMDDAMSDTSPESIATRVISQLAMNTMLSVLSSKNVTLDALLPFGGALLFPRCFVHETGAVTINNDTQRLLDSMNITAQPQFVGIQSTGVRGAVSTSEIRMYSESLTRPTTVLCEDRRSASYDKDVDNSSREPLDSKNQNVEFYEKKNMTLMKKSSDNCEKSSSSRQSSKRARSNSVTPQVVEKDERQQSVPVTNAATTTTINTKISSDPSKLLSSPVIVPADLDEGTSIAIYRSIVSLASGFTKMQLGGIKFKEVKEAVHTALNRRWSDTEKDYAKTCLAQILKDLK